MSTPISSMPTATVLAAADSFTILKAGQPDATKNQQITKTNALAGMTENPTVAGNSLRNLTSWVAAGGAALLNVGTTAGTVAAGDRPVAAVTSHEGNYTHGNLPSTAQKEALNGASTASSANPFATVADIVDEGADLKSTGQTAQKILVTDGTNGFVYEAKPTGTGGLTAVVDDPAPVLGGNLQMAGNRILVTDAVDAFHGALGYSPTVGALFLSENTPGDYFEDKAGLSMQNGVASLHGSVAQMKSLVGTGNREVHCDPDGNLFPVVPAPPTWKVEDQSTAKVSPQTTGGTGAWVMITNLSIRTIEDVTIGTPMWFTTRAYINNIAAGQGDLEFGWGIVTAQPTQPGAIVPIAPLQSGYVTASTYTETLSAYPADTVVQAWVRAISATGVSFGPWVDGTLGYAHNLTVEAVSAGASGDATSIQGTPVTPTTPTDGNILVYRSTSSAYVLEAKPASGSTPSAAEVTFQPTGNVAANNVQLAIVELDTEKSATSHTHTGVYEPAGVSAADITDGTTAGRALLTAADAAAQRTSLGLGTAATTAATDYATAAQGALAASATQPGDDAADQGSGAATDGYVLTADGAGGAAWEAATGGSGATLTPIATYTIQGSTSLTESAGTLTIPLDGKSYTYTLPSNTSATTLALSGEPTAPICGDVVIVLKQAASGGPHTVAYPAAWNWPNGAEVQISATAGARMRVTIASDALGVIDASAEWMS